MSAPNMQAQSLHALLTLLQLEHRLRWARPDAARFITVNETARLLPYRQSVLVEWDKDIMLPPRATAASGVSIVDPDSILVRGVLELVDVMKDLAPETAQEIPLPASASPAFITHLEHDKVYALPIKNPRSSQMAALFFLRRQPLTQGEGVVLEKLADAIARALEHENGSFFHRAAGWARHKPLRRWLIVVAVVLLLFPVRASVLAPAEVVGVDPAIIRSPMQGVISSLHIAPNQSVKAGEPLVSFDEEELRAKLESTQQALAAAQAEQRQANVQAVSSADARANLAVVRGRVEQQRISLDYAESLLARSTIIAPSDGIAVFDNTYDWVGRSVSIGERIMLLADPARTQLEVRLPVQDNIALPEKARVLFFSTAAPHRPLAAEVSFASYRASLDERNALSYRIEASWTDVDSENTPRLGSVGNAKIYGSYRPLFWQMLRKPIASLRAFIGL